MNYFGDNEGKEVVLTRSKSHGYKTLKIGSDVEMASPIDFVTENDNELVLHAIEEEPEKLQYTFLCEEFGLYGYKPKKGVSAKVSIIFCDDGKMLVTLLEGSLILKYNEDLIQPIVGDDKYPGVVADEVLWVNADMLLSHKQYFGDKIRQVHTQDFQYVFTLSGGKPSEGTSFILRRHTDEYVDLSLGHVAVMEDEERKKESAKRAQQLVRMSVPPENTEDDGLDFDFDDDEEEEDDDYGFEYED